MKNSPKIIGLVQALGLVLYITLFAVTATTAIELLKARFPIHDPNPIIPIVFFLLAFVTFALICSTIAFGYPARLFFQDKKEVALRIVFWNIIWLIAAFALFLAGTLLL